MSYIPSIANFHSAYQTMKDSPYVTQTRLELSRKLSDKYKCKVYLKREDMQVSRSFKIRGALNQIQKLKPHQREKGKFEKFRIIFTIFFILSFITG